jgi:hypothetical protein
MKWLMGVRKWMATGQLRKELAKPRRRVACGFSKAKSVAIVYREQGESFFILVKQYVQHLKAEYGIREVLAMCYIEDPKQIPHYHVHRLKYDYFTGSDVNFSLRPISDAAQSFAERPFDILIDLEREPCIPLQYIVAISKATFKVGRYTEQWPELYDLMLKVPEQATFDAYIAQVNHYLQKLNTTHARA